MDEQAIGMPPSDEPGGDAAWPPHLALRALPEPAATSSRKTRRLPACNGMTTFASYRALGAASADGARTRRRGD